jgi:thiol-disulfide isomerase/thioredoxin
MGTWCPNCLDETRFYKELYEKYHDKGLEIIAIGFEAGENFDLNAAKLEKFKAKNGVDFTFLLGGTSTKKAASDLFPMVDGIKSFPTSFYIGKDGTIQKIYTGFNGPGTGIYYEKYVEETYKVIEGMLK